MTKSCSSTKGKKGRRWYLGLMFFCVFSSLSAVDSDVWFDVMCPVGVSLLCFSCGSHGFAALQAYHRATDWQEEISTIILWLMVVEQFTCVTQFIDHGNAEGRTAGRRIWSKKWFSFLLRSKEARFFFFFLEENVQPSLCFLLSCGKFCRLRGCDPIKRAKFRRIYACDVGVWLLQGSAPPLFSNLRRSNRRFSPGGGFAFCGAGL